MDKNRNYLLPLAIWAIILIVFNVLVFMFSEAEGRTGTFWCSYVFTMLAILLQPAITWVVFGRGQQKRQSVFLGLPILRFMVIYFIVQLIVGTVFMVFSKIDVKIAVAAQLVLLAIAIIACVAALQVRNYAEQVADKVKPKTFYIRSLAADVRAMESRANDPALKQALHGLVESIEYSDPMSHDSLFALEQKIESNVAYLGQLLAQGDIQQANGMIKELNLLLGERNQKTKLLK
ncbi:MAG: hypothetical protein LBR39_05755 [Coriobacteriales bacterium]|nr:hypothetical protein [Coriobacteriales bacterium]